MNEAIDCALEAKKQWEETPYEHRYMCTCMSMLVEHQPGMLEIAVLNPDDGSSAFFKNKADCYI